MNDSMQPPRTPPELINAVTQAPIADPRTVPVMPPTELLPPIAPQRLMAQALRARCANPPEWSPEVRREPPSGVREPAQAAVLIPIVQHPQPTVLLTERSTRMRQHSGQIAFPGGRLDPEDAGPAAAAIREAWEEVGLPPGHVEVIGNLPTYVTITSFIVTPVIALVRPGFSLVPNPDEVADVFEVPLGFLMDPAHHRRHVFADAHGSARRQFFSMPYQDGAQERFIWGATAGMLRNLYRFLAA